MVKSRRARAVLHTAAILCAALLSGGGCQRPASTTDEPRTASTQVRPAGKKAAVANSDSGGGSDRSARRAAELSPSELQTDDSPSNGPHAEPRVRQAVAPATVPRPNRIDQGRIAAAGLRRLEGDHLTIYTDISPDSDVDRLPTLFDQACPEWCSYFNVSPKKLEGWRMIACLMKDQERFREAGLLPEDLPPFLHGFARGDMLWLNEQPTDYYRRHLLLHEGTHAFTDAMLGYGEPPWYREAMAELLATHRLENGRLQLGSFPQHREQVPMLGRIKLVQQAVAGGRLMRLEDVLHLPDRAFLDNEPYAWSWALAAFLDGHPRYRDRFRRLASETRGTNFADRFRSTFAADWHRLDEEWQIFASELEHGHDLEASAIDFAAGEPLPTEGREVTVRAELGWQNTGVRLEEAQEYQLKAEGRYQVAQEPQIWWCEPGGVSIRYYKGRPLGVLLAAVRPEDAKSPTDRCGLLDAEVVGLRSIVTFPSAGTLYLRINDSAGELGDNAGTLSVSIEAQ